MSIDDAGEDVGFRGFGCRGGGGMREEGREDTAVGDEFVLISSELEAVHGCGG